MCPASPARDLKVRGKKLPLLMNLACFAFHKINGWNTPEWETGRQRGNWQPYKALVHGISYSF